MRCAIVFGAFHNGMAASNALSKSCLEDKRHFNVIITSTVRVDWKWIRCGKGKFLVLRISTKNHLGLAFPELSWISKPLKSGDSRFMDYELAGFKSS